MEDCTGYGYQGENNRTDIYNNNRNLNGRLEHANILC